MVGDTGWAALRGKWLIGDQLSCDLCCCNAGGLNFMWHDVAIFAWGTHTHTHIYIYSSGLKHRMTIWKSLGVSEKLTCCPPGPKPHVFELFFRLENLEWVTEMLRNTAPVSQNRSGTQNIEWVFAHSWHKADFQKKIGHNSKSTRHSKFGSHFGSPGKLRGYNEVKLKLHKFKLTSS